MIRNDDMDKEELEQRCLNMIEEHQDKAVVLGEEAYRTPELGHKEFRTRKLIGEVFHKLGLEPEAGISYTDYRISSSPKGNDPGMAMMDELGRIMCDIHPDVAEGGLVYAYGCSIRLANLCGAVLGIPTSNAMEHPGGAADFIAIPAGECVDYEYRNRLMSQGTIHYLGGKQELIHRRGLDDTDMVLRCRMMEMESERRCILNIKGNRSISETVHFLGRTAHVEFAPEQGIGTLNVAEPTMNNIHVLGEAFKDEDGVQVSIIIKGGGSLMNVVPERVIIEVMVRILAIDTMEGASRKVNRSMKTVVMTLGGKAEIHDYTGYPPLGMGRQIARLYQDNMIAYERAGGDASMEDQETTGSTDLGDISQITPCVRIWADDVKSSLHTERYRMDDPYTTYIVPAKIMTLIIIDLLWGGGARGKEIMGDFRPALTKEKYLNLLKDRQAVNLYDVSDL